MKTKHILTTAILALSIAGLTGCSKDFLEVNPPTADPVDEYYTTDAHIQEALVAAYDPLHWPDWGNGSYSPLNLCSDIMADDIYPGGATASDLLELQLMENYNADPDHTLSALWTDEYTGVKRCNDVLAYLETAIQIDGVDITEDNAKSYRGQARVLRAYYYMNLWKFWGNIPYYTTNLSGDYKAPQLSADEVYTNVITDLEDALSQYGAQLPMKASAGNEGRVTKAFAYMVYAEMVMYQNDQSRYAKALEYMNEIINSGNYALNPSFEDIWKESGEWCAESIFEVNYDDANHARGWSTPLAVGGTVLPRLLGPRGWTSGVAGVDNGWGFGPVRQECYDMFADNDTRRDATCFNADKVAEENGITYTPAWQHTGFFLNKYLPLTENVKDAGWDADLNFNNNYRIYRFSETLLNAAELLVRTNGDQSIARSYVNKVRARAGLSDLTSLSVDDIINERHLEFVGEGKRYWDLVRSGKAASTLVPDAEGYRTATWSESKKYLPIPQSEISADANLVQNNY